VHRVEWVDPRAFFTVHWPPCDQLWRWGVWRLTAVRVAAIAAGSDLLWTWEWTDHVKSPGVIVERRRQEYYITAVTLAALITRLCIAGSNAPSWQNRTRNWRTCDSRLNGIGIGWWRWTLIVMTSARVWRQRWHCVVWSRQQSDESVTWSDGVSSHYVDELTVVSVYDYRGSSCPWRVTVCPPYWSCDLCRSVAVERVKAVRWPVFKSFGTPTDCPQSRIHFGSRIELCYFVFNYFW